MLFHTQAFLLAFLPLTLAAYYALAGWGAWRRWTTIAASLVFYGYWDWRLIPLLVGSVVANWLLSMLPPRLPLRAVVVLGVAANLLLLGVFKYADFAVASVEALVGLRHDPFGIVLPLGISFFTFQQISYLVDLGRGEAPRYRFADYALWVALFPHLIAGPIIRHHEIIEQFKLEPRRSGLAERLARGFVLLTLGIGKKVLLADPLARLADPIFQAASEGRAVGLVDGWCAGLAFALQIYFDFSGYSDMAMGLGLLLGLMLPLNFLAPYRATSIRDFWRRWHITLSRFLRDYLYIPMGGNRLGRLGRAGATLATMLLGGLWHGAGWTFVAWGGLHGAALALNQAWAGQRRRIPAWLGWLLTMLVVVAGFVLFRASSFPAAAEVLTGMAGLHGKGRLTPGAREWWLIPLAGLAATIGPTAHQLALEKLKPSPWLAVATALLFVYLLLAVGGGRNTEFIYFQF
ncbi:MAG: MBOAT family protein [Alphaproteobacteria bacterium]|nr:MBOAT family protein [Alphaproteobacteria bacterium]